MFRPDRSKRGHDRYLAWKVRLFAAGATLGVAGMLMNWQALVWVAIVVLIVGFMLRFLPADSEGPGSESDGAGASGPTGGPGSSGTDPEP